MTRVAVIVNPSKFQDVDTERRALEEVCARHGLEAPLWIETTEEDPGGGQAREALDQGADLVCAFGGDGTVRAVGEVLAGSDVPLGLLPGGTGNLLARTLGLAVDDVQEALEVALGDHEVTIDVGVLRADGEEERVFLVMAGMGLDAQMMDNTDERLKAAVGWVAYIVGGVRSLVGGGFGARVKVDGGPVLRRRARAIVIGNSGQLQGGLELMPEAVLDDGLLDVAIVAPRGIAGWTQALFTLVTAGPGHRHLDRHQAKTVRVRADKATTAQLDGDPIGDYRELEVTVRRHALRVRVAPKED